MAAPPFVAAESNTASASGTLTVDAPAGIVDGDLLLGFIGWGDASTITPPAGWTLLRDTLTSLGTANPRSAVFWKWAASEPASYTWTVPYTDADSVGIVGAWRDVDDTPFVAHARQNTQRVAPTVTAEAESRLVCFWNGKINAGTPIDVTPPAGMTERHQVIDPFKFGFLADQEVNAGATGTRTVKVYDSVLEMNEAFHTTRPNLSVVLRHLNRPPNASTLVAPVAAVPIDRTVDQLFEWLFSDPDVGDTQSGFDFQARLAATVPWTVTESETTANEFVEIAGGTFSAGLWEWQVVVYDADGEPSPASTSGFFTAADPPDAPVWTDPVDGATITTNTYEVEWTAAAQDAYEIRVVADDAGTPDTTEVYQTVTGGAAPRARVLTFPTNEIWLHPQIRVQVDGLWSEWDSIRNYIEFTEPAAPTVAVVPNMTPGAITVTVTNPAPTGDQPEVESNDMWRVPIDPDTGEATGEAIPLRDGAGLDPDGTFDDWAVAADQSYAYMAVANGANGTTSQSDWSA